MQIQSELQSNALSFFFVENLTILLKLADVLQKLVEYLAERAEQCQLLRSIVIFPEYLLRCYTIVRKNYVTMAQEAEGLEAMKSLYAACKKLLVAFLELLYPREACPGRGSYFRAMDHDEEYGYLEKGKMESPCMTEIAYYSGRKYKHFHSSLLLQCVPCWQVWPTKSAPSIRC